MKRYYQKMVYLFYMRRYKSHKFYEWNHEIAYISGLIASDGCLVNDGRHINLTSSDVDLLETLRSLLKLSGPVKQKPNGYGGTGYYVQFSDVALYDFLYEAGIKPAKSKTIEAIDVPDKFYADFLRGYFDGDGCIYGFWDRRWPNSLMYYTEYASASLKFLKWLQSKNSKLAHTADGRIKQSTRVYALSYAKLDSQKLYSFMYHDLTLPFLSRKHNKFVDFIGKDPYASKELLREWRNR